MDRDCLTVLIDDLRGSRPPLYESERFAEWGKTYAEAVQALPRFEQRWAAVALTANDLAGAHALPVSLAFPVLAGMILSAEDCARLRAIGKDPHA
jgi:hypothetical protein